MNGLDLQFAWIVNYFPGMFMWKRSGGIRIFQHSFELL